MSWQRLVIIVGMAALVCACTGSAATALPQASLAVSPPPAAVSTEPSALPSPTGSTEPSIAPSPSTSTNAGPSSGPSATVVPGAPPTPTKVTFKFVNETVAQNGSSTERYRATWSEPAGAATKFLVIGVLDCLRSSQEDNDQPCVVAGMAIPVAETKLIETASGSTRSTDVTWTLEGEAGGAPYQAVLLVAENGVGRSVPAVLFSSLVCYGCVI